MAHPPPWMGAMFGGAPPAAPPPKGVGAPPGMARPMVPVVPRAPAAKGKAKAKAGVAAGPVAFGPAALGMGAYGMGGFGAGMPFHQGVGPPFGPQFPPAPPMGSPLGGNAPGSDSSAPKTGPWLHLPLLQYGVLPHLQPRALIELSLVDPAGGGMPYGTLIVSVVCISQVDHSGVFLEGSFVGCSVAHMAQAFAQLLAMPYVGALLHLCFAPYGCQTVAPHGRQHIHTTMIRTRNKTSLSKPWISQGWGGYASDDAPAAVAAVAARYRLQRRAKPQPTLWWTRNRRAQVRPQRRN